MARVAKQPGYYIAGGVPATLNSTTMLRGATYAWTALGDWRPLIICFDQVGVGSPKRQQVRRS
jgi:hypothetical protein